MVFCFSGIGLDASDLSECLLQQLLPLSMIPMQRYLQGGRIHRKDVLHCLKSISLCSIGLLQSSRFPSSENAYRGVYTIKELWVMGYNIDEMKTIDTSTSTFEDFIRSELLYVDKSRYAYDILSSKEATIFRFMARPRRFGKHCLSRCLRQRSRGRGGCLMVCILGRAIMISIHILCFILICPVSRPQRE